jgi:hypothetical protein
MNFCSAHEATRQKPDEKKSKENIEMRHVIMLRLTQKQCLGAAAGSLQSGVPNRAVGDAWPDDVKKRTGNRQSMTPRDRYRHRNHEWK